MSYNPMFDGPSRNHQALADAEHVWREEAFDITPQSVPVTLQTQTARPVTTLPVRDLTGGTVTVLSRTSNQDPAAAGTGPGHSTWLDRSPLDKPFLGEDPAPTAGLQKTILISALLGVGVWFLFLRK